MTTKALDKLILSTIIFSFFTFSFSNVFSQTISKLDEQHGFKDLKLGDLRSKWNNSLTYIQTIDKVASYNFNLEKCCNTIFDMNVESITLNFKDEKLVGINIETVKIQKGSSQGEPTRIENGFKKYESFVNNFTSLFGKPSGRDMPDRKDGLTNRAQWLGIKTFLELDYYYYGVLNGDGLKIGVWDMGYVKSKTSQGF